MNYEGAINSEVVFARSDYFNGHLVRPLGRALWRLSGFLVLKLVINSNATQEEIARAFGVPLVTVKRYMKLYREGGAAAFFPTTPAPITASNTGNSLIFISGNNLLTDGCMVRPITTQSPESVEGRVFIGVTVGRGVHRHLVEHAKGPVEVNDHLPDAD